MITCPYYNHLCNTKKKQPWTDVIAEARSASSSWSSRDVVMVPALSVKRYPFFWDGTTTPEIHGSSKIMPVISWVCWVLQGELQSRSAAIFQEILVVIEAGIGQEAHLQWRMCHKTVKIKHVSAGLSDFPNKFPPFLLRILIPSGLDLDSITSRGRELEPTLQRP